MQLEADLTTKFGGVVDPFAAWIDSAAFNSPPLTTEQKLPGADPDGDGMSNQEEFAFGLNPVLGSSINPITVPLNKATHKFSYTRLSTSGLTYTVLTSTDLVTWDSAAVTESLGTLVDGVQTLEATLTAPLAGDKLFVRVQAQ
ncbi:MAG: hypothetical protein NTW21_09620 [Verrucomicrobia bacterium]|nr:hypothetical protein [Verrucomicrobiota bacterium]